MSADQIIAALRSGHDELATAIRSLAPDDLVRQSGASEWQVSQVLSHLGSGAEIHLAALNAAQGRESAPDGDFNRTVWARWDAMPPKEHADGFIEANQRLVEAYESLDETTRAQLRVHLGFLPAPVDIATAARIRLSEFALHQWDVAVTFDPQATVAPESVPPLLDLVAGMMAWLAKPEALGGRTATLALRLSDPDRAYGLQLGEQIAVTDLPERPDGELTAPAEAWLRLTTGRLKPPYTPGSVRLTGPLDLDDLRKVFPGY